MPQPLSSGGSRPAYSGCSVELPVGRMDSVCCGAGWVVLRAVQAVVSSVASVWLVSQSGAAVGCWGLAK